MILLQALNFLDGLNIEWSLNDRYLKNWYFRGSVSQSKEYISETTNFKDKEAVSDSLSRMLHDQWLQNSATLMVKYVVWLEC